MSSRLVLAATLAFAVLAHSACRADTDAGPAPDFRALRAAHLDDQLKADEAKRGRAGWVGGVCAVVGLAGYKAYTLSQSGGDQDNLAIAFGEGALMLCGAFGTSLSLAFGISDSFEIHDLMNQRQGLSKVDLQVAPVLAQGRAPGLGLTARF